MRESRTSGSVRGALSNERPYRDPPGGPIFAGLSILHQSHLLSHKPAGSALDDGEFESGALYENNALFAEIRKGLNDWSLLDVHSGLYLLGTRDLRSEKLTS